MLAALPFVIIAAIAVSRLVIGPGWGLLPLLAVGPAVAAAVGGPRYRLAASGVAVAVCLLFAVGTQPGAFGQRRPDHGLSRADRRSTMTPPTQVATWRRESPGVWVVTLNRPPANALGVLILEGLHAAIDTAERARDVKVMIMGPM